MLDEATRTAILRLHEAGQHKRTIARALGIARTSVERVIESGSAEVPALKRTELAEGYVHVNRTRYSVPYRWNGHTLIGHTLEVRETRKGRCRCMQAGAAWPGMRGCTDRSIRA